MRRNRADSGQIRLEIATVGHRDRIDLCQIAFLDRSENDRVDLSDIVGVPWRTRLTNPNWR